jgi:hypothetical protein
MRKPAEILNQFILAACQKDVSGMKLACSPEFVRHEGKGLDDFCAYEIEAYHERYNRIGIFDFSITVEPIVGEEPVCLASFFDQDGIFVFDMQYWITESGITGDNSNFEVVSKLLFESPLRIRRNIAVRDDAGGQLGSVIPRGRNIQSFEFMPKKHADDGFYNCVYDIINDDYFKCQQRITIAKPGCVETKNITMRGMDHPYFFHSQWPILNRNELIMPDGPYPWCLAVTLADGTQQLFKNPLANHTMRFDKPVVTAILTDRLDNDWRVSVAG